MEGTGAILLRSVLEQRAEVAEHLTARPACGSPNAPTTDTVAAVVTVAATTG